MTKPTIIGTVLAISVCCEAYVQTAPAPSFEVAAIKSYTPDPAIRVCMCEDTGGIAYRGMSMRNIIRRAYDLQDLQLEGPDW